MSTDRTRTRVEVAIRVCGSGGEEDFDATLIPWAFVAGRAASLDARRFERVERVLSEIRKQLRSPDMARNWFERERLERWENLLSEAIESV